MPSAASVPSTVARSAVRIATCSEFVKPRDHCGSSTILAYHWSEKPSGGHDRIWAPVKLIGMTTSMGPTRKTTVAAPSATSASRRGVRQVPRSPMA